MNRVLVLGGGSAGFLAGITLKARLPDLEVTVLRSQAIGTIGVGIENHKLASFLESYASGLKVVIRDDTVVEALQDDSGITGWRPAPPSPPTCSSTVPALPRSSWAGRSKNLS